MSQDNTDAEQARRLEMRKEYDQKIKEDPEINRAYLMRSLETKYGEPEKPKERAPPQPTNLKDRIEDAPPESKTPSRLSRIKGALSNIVRGSPEERKHKEAVKAAYKGEKQAQQIMAAKERARAESNPPIKQKRTGTAREPPSQLLAQMQSHFARRTNIYSSHFGTPIAKSKPDITKSTLAPRGISFNKPSFDVRGFGNVQKFDITRSALAPSQQKGRKGKSVQPSKKKVSLLDKFAPSRIFR